MAIVAVETVIAKAYATNGLTNRNEFGIKVLYFFRFIGLLSTFCNIRYTLIGIYSICF